ncbi:unnamed protein product [Ceutorhynchus assimilis]|uniref:EF-hand domain-containing protein n=1 Tax=Ceutorhynchus assimilis TaxID=467358 RepID=A0A9P0DD49_9CUCU|nr:unnamed protein product [Ceutorhynchus assimilis]
MSPNDISLSLTLFQMLVTITFARGPHHPRGEPLVKRHTHYTPGKNAEKITQDFELLHDKEHIEEHLKEVAPKIDLSKMTDAEIELFYFLLHDTDKNSKLDGLELLNAILHTTHDNSGHQHIYNRTFDDENGNDIDNPEMSEGSFEHFVDLVDQVLKEDDKNQDGYLDYTEYVDGKKTADRLADKLPSVELT